MLKKKRLCRHVRIMTVSFCVNYIMLTSQNIYFFISQNIYFYVYKKNDYVEKKFFLHYDIIVLC